MRTVFRVSILFSLFVSGVAIGLLVGWLDFTLHFWLEVKAVSDCQL